MSIPHYTTNSLNSLTKDNKQLPAQAHQFSRESGLSAHAQSPPPRVHMRAYFIYNERA